MNTILVRLFVAAAAFAIGVSGAWIQYRYNYANYSAFADCSMPVNDTAGHEMAERSLVYYAVLGDRTSGYITPWVVEEMTDGGGPDIKALLEHTDMPATPETLEGFLVSLGPDMIANYRLNNSTRSSLRQVIGNHKDVMLYNETDAKLVTMPVAGGERKMDWAKFMRRLGSKRKYTFSEIAFNTSHDQAFVFLRIESGDGRYPGEFFIRLEKKNHDWLVAKKLELWVQS